MQGALFLGCGIVVDCEWMKLTVCRRSPWPGRSIPYCFSARGWCQVPGDEPACTLVVYRGPFVFPRVWQRPRALENLLCPAGWPADDVLPIAPFMLEDGRPSWARGVMASVFGRHARIEDSVQLPLLQPGAFPYSAPSKRELTTPGERPRARRSCRPPGCPAQGSARVRGRG